MTKKVEKEIPEEKNVKPKKEYIGDLRGFKTYEEMINYPNTPEFQKLDNGCKAEFTSWLKKISEEEK